MKGVAKTPELGKMLDVIRENHIDIKEYIIEEINDILPQIIEETIISVYKNITGEKQW